MTRAEQTIQAHMWAIRDAVRSGATEMVGKTYRDPSGKVAGRYKSGFMQMFPEVQRAGMTPGEAAKSIELGKGKRFNRLARAIVDQYHIDTRKRGRGHLSVSPHGGNRKCKHCEAFHSKSEHRFHGKGSFHATHMFSFNPRRKRNPCGMQKNPVVSTVIYGRVLAIEAQKTQKHVCDDECKSYQHRYRHDFKPGAVMYGLSDGSILIKSK